MGLLLRICPIIKNWQGFRRGILDQLEVELRHELVQDDFVALIDDVQRALAQSKADRDGTLAGDFSVVRLRIERDGIELSLFSVMTTFKLPLDATIGEPRIETFLPAHGPSREFLFALDESVHRALNVPPPV